MADSTVFYQCAITCKVPREASCEQLRELLEDSGYEDSPEVYDPTGEYVLARVYGDEEVGTCIQIYDQPVTYLPFAQSLAVLFGRPVVFHELTVTGEPGSDDWAKVMVLSISPDGGQEDVPPSLNLEKPIEGLDRYKASRRLLRALIDPAIDGHPDKPAELWMYREVEEFIEEEEEEPAISPRLQAIIDDVGRANAVSLTDLYGKTALKMELPDGTNRMSVVSDDDLAVIRQETGVTV